MLMVNAAHPQEGLDMIIRDRDQIHALRRGLALTLESTQETSDRNSLPLPQT